jgi:thiol-disulfide isomerase/thioredoxin
MNKYLYSFLGLLFLVGVVWLIQTPGKPSKYDDFAKCITAKKTVTFFGAFWCPHCQAEKARFGKAAQYLPYVECSTPDGQGQLPICTNAGVTTYPTWDFATGTSPTATTSVRRVGEIELVDLAEITQCELPK